MIPQHQCRTQSLQQQRHGTGALLAQILVAQVQPTRRRMAVNELATGEVEAVRPTGRRHHSTLSRHLQERRGKRQNRQSHTVVTTQVANLVQRTRDNLRVLELREGALRVVQSRVNRCIRERTVHRQHNTLRTAALSQVVVGNCDLFSSLRLDQRHVTTRQAAKLLEALRDIRKHRVRVLRPGERSGGQELSERHFLFLLENFLSSLRIVNTSVGCGLNLQRHKLLSSLSGQLQQNLIARVT
ncbi:Uncharacterised protein [Mycobacterium tuberculosis]|nr:Uncharacterised protein [Mycobacterium tuberculosis]